MNIESIKVPLTQVQPATYIAAGLGLACVCIVLCDPAARQVLATIAREQKILQKLLIGVQHALE